MKSLINYINEQLITESYINVFTPELIRPFTKEAWEIISKAYEYIGGVAGCPNYETFVKYYCDNADDELFMWKMARRNNKITAIKIYTKKRGGRKGIIIASDGTPQGNKDISRILYDDYNMKDRLNWDELSGKALGKALKQGAIPLPNTVIRELMPDKKIKPLKDGWFYRRKLGNEIHTKVLVGFPTGEESNNKCSSELIQKIKELGKKYESGEFDEEDE